MRHEKRSIGRQKRIGLEWHDLASYVPALLGIVVVIVFLSISTRNDRDRFMKKEKELAVESLSALSAQLQTNITGNIKLLQGLVAVIATEPRIDQEKFSSIGEQIFRARSQLLGVSAAPHFVVKLVYPDAVGRETIGHDFQKNEESRQSVLRAREMHDFVLERPIAADDGRTILTVRLPVYVTRGKSLTFWGIVSGAVDLHQVFNDTGLEARNLDVVVSLQSHPVKQADVFFGSLAVTHDDPVMTSIDLGYDTWYLSARPKGGWPASPNTLLFRCAMAASSACVVAPLIWVGYLLRSRQRTIFQLEHREHELERSRATVEHQALHDALTGLPNRRYLDQLMAGQKASDAAARYALIHIDLDRFKEVNDTLGHAAGDMVLQISADRQKSLLDPTEFVARIGGDEFVVVLHSNEPETRAEFLAKQIVAVHNETFQIADNECKIGASVGVAWQSFSKEDLTHILSSADLALYEAKRSGRGCVGIYAEDLRASTIQRRHSEDEALAALEQNQFVPFFQPQVDARTFEIVGVEALARWDHPTKGRLSPEYFLDTLEGLQRLGELDARMLDKTLFQAARWAADGVRPPRISVNISPQRLQDPRLLESLEAARFEKGYLSFELLESISFDKIGTRYIEKIKAIRNLGIEIEIDDFGSGHASIVSLIEIAPDRLKIDRKLVSPIVGTASQRKLVASIIEIGRSLNIKVIAEGVETMEHVHILQDLGCDILQGYAIAKPMSAEDFTVFLRDNKSHLLLSKDARQVRKLLTA